MFLCLRIHRQDAILSCMNTAVKRLTLDMTPDEHRRLKTLAAFHGVTMRDFLLSNLFSDEKPARKSVKAGETAYLLRSARNRKRLLESLARGGARRKAFRSVKELKHALGV